MNKLFKTILISLIVISGAGFLVVSPANAIGTVNPLIVEWSITGTAGWQPLTGAIFNEANFLPGSDVIRYIRVTNYSGQTQKIAIEAINQSDSDHLASQMNLVINKQGGINIFNGILRKFFDQGETYLSDVAAGAQTIYDITITFDPGTGNAYQAKTLGFDILVGFQGTEGGLPDPLDGGGTSITTFGTTGNGGGGGAPSGLTIQSESSFCVSVTDAIVAWGTSYKSTSRVVYGTHSGVFNLSLPKYGYDFTTLEYDNLVPISTNGVTGHTVNITGLSPNTTYYYKVISHASPDTVGGELSFTTLSPGERKPCCTETITNNTPEQPDSSLSQVSGQGRGAVALLGDGTGAEQEPNQGGSPEEITSGEQPKEKEPGTNFSNLLASIASFFNMGNYCGVSTLPIIIIVILYLLSRSNKKNGQERKKRYWDLIIAIIILVILEMLLKCWLLIIPIIILVVAFALELMKKENK